MGKSSSSRSESIASRFYDRTGPVQVEVAFFVAAVGHLEHLEALLSCMSANNRKAFKALSSKEKNDILAFAHSVAYHAKSELESGCY